MSLDHKSLREEPLAKRAGRDSGQRDTAGPSTLRGYPDTGSRHVYAVSVPPPGSDDSMSGLAAAAFRVSS